MPVTELRTPPPAKRGEGQLGRGEVAQELIYTSAPKGLKLGASGFCTVACTQGMAANYIEALEERFSGYTFVYPPHHEKAWDNPPAYSHFLVKLGGKQVSVLSRVAYCGVDHTRRTNKLAWHLVLEPQERAAGGPAWIQQQPGVFPEQWDGKPGYIPTQRKIPAGDDAPGVCRAWEDLLGDAGWAGVVAQAFSDKPREAAFLLFEPGMDLLPLVAEALRVLPRPSRWQVTYCTYFTQMPFGATCVWRCCLAGSPAAGMARRGPGALCLDLTRGPNQPDAAKALLDSGSPLVECAREGTAPPEPEAQTPREPRRPMPSKAAAFAPAPAVRARTAPAAPATQLALGRRPSDQEKAPKQWILALAGLAILILCALLAFGVIIRKPPSPPSVAALDPTEAGQELAPPDAQPSHHEDDTESQQSILEFDKGLDGLRSPKEKQKPDADDLPEVADAAQDEKQRALDEAAAKEEEERRRERLRQQEARDKEASAFAGKTLNFAFNHRTAVFSSLRLGDGSSKWPIPGLPEGWHIARLGLGGRAESFEREGRHVIEYPDSMGLPGKVLVVAAKPEGLEIGWDPASSADRRVLCLESVEWVEFAYRTRDGDVLTSHWMLNPVRRQVRLDEEFEGRAEIPQVLASVLERRGTYAESVRDRGGLLADVSVRVTGNQVSVKAEYEFVKQVAKASGEGRDKDATPDAPDAPEVDDKGKPVEAETVGPDSQQDKRAETVETRRRLRDEARRQAEMKRGALAREKRELDRLAQRLERHTNDLAEGRSVLRNTDAYLDMAEKKQRAESAKKAYEEAEDDAKQQEKGRMEEAQAAYARAREVLSQTPAAVTVQKLRRGVADARKARDDQEANVKKAEEELKKANEALFAAEREYRQLLELRESFTVNENLRGRFEEPIRIELDGAVVLELNLGRAN